MTEHLPYTVVRRHDGFEVRQYPAHVLAQVEVSGDVASGAGVGFGPLFRYISGGNARGQSIAMTAPVLQHPGAEGRQIVSFVMPTGMDSASAPAPSDPRVRTASVPPRLVAARRFSGSARASRFRDEGARLMAAVLDAGLTSVGDVSFARFDPPWTPGFLRHNEALVEIADTGASSTSPAQS